MHLQFVKMLLSRNIWVAQWFKCLSLHFGSGYDLKVIRLSLISDFTLGMESA